MSENKIQANKPEPFGYFKAEPFGWTDCSEHDEGAIALYEHAPDSAAKIKELEQEVKTLRMQSGTFNQRHADDTKQITELENELAQYRSTDIYRELADQRQKLLVSMMALDHVLAARNIGSAHIVARAAIKTVKVETQ